jgi:hypothetical protein
VISDLAQLYLKAEVYNRLKAAAATGFNADALSELATKLIGHAESAIASAGQSIADDLVKLNADRWTRLPRVQFVHWGSQWPTYRNEKSGDTWVQARTWTERFKPAELYEYLAEIERDLFYCGEDSELIIFRRELLVWRLEIDPGTDLIRAHCDYGSVYITGDKVADIEMPSRRAVDTLKEEQGWRVKARQLIF